MATNALAVTPDEAEAHVMFGYDPTACVICASHALAGPLLVKNWKGIDYLVCEGECDRIDRQDCARLAEAEAGWILER